MRNMFICLLASFILFSCGKDESSLNTTTTTTTTTTSETWVKLSVKNTQGVAQAGLKVMMFNIQPSNSSPLPSVIKEVVSDANGLAYFDLNMLVTTSIPVTYYFEAFRESGGNLIWESINHPSWDLKKGSMVTSSIVVN